MQSSRQTKIPSLYESLTLKKEGKAFIVKAVEQFIFIYLTRETGKKDFIGCVRGLGDVTVDPWSFLSSLLFLFNGGHGNFRVRMIEEREHLFSIAKCIVMYSIQKNPRLNLEWSIYTYIFSKCLYFLSWVLPLVKSVYPYPKYLIKNCFV